MYFWYDAFGSLCEVLYDDNGTASAYMVVCNSRGDVERLYDVTGNLAARYVYDSWGNVISVVDSSNRQITNQNAIGNVNPIRYRGYYLDSETGYYYLQSRYYNPQLGRFINADKICDTQTGVLGTNMFSYCENNPIMFMDFDGRDLTWATVFDILSTCIVVDTLFPGFRMPANISYGYIKSEDIPPKSSGYKPPKGGARKVPIPGNKSGGKGWLDRRGNVWSPDKLHKDHWDVIPKNGKGHKNIYPDGHERNNSSSISLDDFSFGVSNDPIVVICIVLLIAIVGSVLIYVLPLFLLSGA